MRAICRLGILVLSVSTVLGAPVAAALPADAVDAVRRVLTRSPAGDSRDRDKVVDQLEELGPEALAFLFDLAVGDGLELLLTESDEVDWWCGPDLFGGLAYDRLLRLSARSLKELVLPREDVADPERLLLAVELLGTKGRAEELGAVLELAGALGQDAFRNRRYRLRFAEAIASLLTRDDGTWAALGRVLQDSDGPGFRLALEAVRSVSRPESLVVLGRVLEANPRLEHELLEPLVEIAARFPWRGEADVLDFVRPLLSREDPEDRRLGAILLGKLGQASVFDALVECLEHESHPRVQRALQWSLENLSGTCLPESSAEWWAWRRRLETRWAGQEGDLREGLTSTDPKSVRRALVRVPLEPLYRDALAKMTVDILWNEERELAFLACDRLEALEARVVVPDLVDFLMSGPEQDLGEEVWKLLCIFTGHDLPLDPWAWSEYVNG